MTTDNTSAPTLREVVQKMTPLEKAVTVAHLDAGMECNGAETLDAMLSDNMTFADVAEIAQRTGLTKKPRSRRKASCLWAMRSRTGNPAWIRF